MKKLQEKETQNQDGDLTKLVFHYKRQSQECSCSARLNISINIPPQFQTIISIDPIFTLFYKHVFISAGNIVVRVQFGVHYLPKSIEDKLGVQHRWCLEQYFN